MFWWLLNKSMFPIQAPSTKLGTSKDQPPSKGNCWKQNRGRQLADGGKVGQSCHYIDIHIDIDIGIHIDIDILYIYTCVESQFPFGREPVTNGQDLYIYIYVKVGDSYMS